MLVVAATWDEAAAHLVGDVALAAVNAPRQLVLGGPPGDVADTTERLENAGIAVHKLPRLRASHTGLMREAAEHMAAVLRTCTLRPPQIPLVSAVTGQVVSAEQARDPEFWARQLVLPIRFAAAAEHVLAQPCTVLEVGPGDTLTRLMKGQLAGGAGSHALVPTLPREPGDERAVFLDALAARSRPGPAAAPVNGKAPPEGECETALAEIWCDVLGLDVVAATDDFLALGGQSLTATVVAGLVRARLGVDIEVRAVFEHPTLRALATHFGGLGSVDNRAPIRPRPAGTPGVLSSAQGLLWFLAQHQPPSAAHHTYRAARIVGTLDVSSLVAALTAVIARHEVLRTVYRLVDGGLVALVQNADATAVSCVDLGPGEVDGWLIDESRRPFDHAIDAPIRVSIARISPREHVLSVVMHHIAGDAWSMSVFFEEVGQAYDACRRGAQPQWPPLEIQYADFAYWQRAALAGGVLDGSLRWWKERLADAAPWLDLPSDRPRPAMSSGRGADLDVPLGAELTEALRRLARDHGCTPFMVLLAGVQLLISGYTGSTDVVVGSPIAGRQRPEVAPLVGCFINPLAFRTDLTGDPTVRELLARVREVSLDAYAHQDVPFEAVVDALGLERSLTRTPLFNVLLNVHNQRPLRLRLDGLGVEWLRIDAGATKLDLTLVVIDDGGPMTIRMIYATDLFDEPTVRRAGDDLRMLLTAMAQGPETAMSALPVQRKSML